MGNIRSGSQARNASLVPENHPQTASLVNDQAANIAEYERSVVERNEDLMNARAVRIYVTSSARPHSYLLFSVRPGAVASETSREAPSLGLALVLR